VTWRPESEADIRALIDSGDAVESHVLDFKREVGTSDRDRNELAADMASFALDGGSLVVGVDETGKDIFTAVPIALEGLVERIEQIAANRVRPPLDVRPRVIPSADDPTVGYVVIDIAESPLRPHMVGGRYYGRGEKTRRHLDDTEVVRLLTARRSAEALVADALEEERARNPQPIRHARAVMAAVPLTADPEAAREFVRRNGDVMHAFVRSIEQGIPGPLRLSSDSPEILGRNETRSKGIAATNLLGGGRQFDNQTKVPGMPGVWNPLDVEVQESGSIRLLVGRVVEHRGIPNMPGRVEALIREASVIAWAHRLVSYADALAAEIGYSGAWGFGVEVYHLRGLRSVHSVEALHSLPVWDADEYSRITTAPGGTLESDRFGIVDRLTSRLAAGLGVETLWRADAFTPPPGSAPSDGQASAGSGP